MRKRILAILAVASALTAAASQANAASTPERLIFDGNVLWNNAPTGTTPVPFSTASGPCTTGVAPGTPITFTVTQLGTTFFTHNTTSKDPLLVDPYNLATPRWDPQLLSPLNAKYATDVPVMGAAALDPWFEQTNYVGAIPYRFADPSQDWTSGWLYTNTAGGLGRTDINYAKPVVILQGQQASNVTLANTNNYLVRGKYQMLSGTTLTIPAGTYLFGEKATTGYIAIDRGARIVVNGTKAQPVVFTSDQDPSVGGMAPGDNGGIVIHGRAIANCANTAAGDSCQSEGGAGSFGGGNDADNSGSIRYLRIEYSGKELSPNNELNSLTMNAVGTGTSIEFVQAHLGSDDAFEWFGGTARCKYLVATGADDDGLDWQLGYRGRVQFAVVQQHPGRGDRGIEADNSEFNFAAPNRSNPAMANLTLVGTNPPTAGAGTNNRGIELRRGTAGAILNSVILGFRGQGLNLSDPETFANCPGTAPPVLVTPVVTAVEQSPLGSRAFVTASPNPSSGSTSIRFGLTRDRLKASAQIFDAQGRLVETLATGPMGKGVHRLQWTPSRSLPTGQYFFRLTAEDGVAAAGKLVMVK
jgi:hypothetical protein